MVDFGFIIVFYGVKLVIMELFGLFSRIADNVGCFTVILDLASRLGTLLGDISCLVMKSLLNKFRLISVVNKCVISNIFLFRFSILYYLTTLLGTTSLLSPMLEIMFG